MSSCEFPLYINHFPEKLHPSQHLHSLPFRSPATFLPQMIMMSFSASPLKTWLALLWPPGFACSASFRSGTLDLSTWNPLLRPSPPCSAALCFITLWFNFSITGPSIYGHICFSVLSLLLPGQMKKVPKGSSGGLLQLPSFQNGIMAKGLSD